MVSLWMAMVCQAVGAGRVSVLLLAGLSSAAFLGCWHPAELYNPVTCLSSERASLAPPPVAKLGRRVLQSSVTGHVPVAGFVRTVVRGDRKKLCCCGGLKQHEARSYLCPRVCSPAAGSLVCHGQQWLSPPERGVLFVQAPSGVLLLRSDGM